MTPIKQRNRHDPENGVYGDCHRAALASLLDLPIDDVPHFMEGLGPKDGEIFNRLQEQFLRSHGLTPVIFAISGTLETVLEQCEVWNPGQLYLLGGESRSGFGHTVIAGSGKIVHDPHPKEVGIVGPMDDGYYWITYLGSAKGIVDGR